MTVRVTESAKASPPSYFQLFDDCAKYLVEHVGGDAHDYHLANEIGITAVYAAAKKAGVEAQTRAIVEATLSASGAVHASIQRARRNAEQRVSLSSSEEPCVELIRGDQLQPEAIAWLWNGYLARGKLHIIAGAPGAGKTTAMIALMATLTSGGRWPDGSRVVPGNVLLWSGEDGIRDTLLPRFLAMGGDPKRMYFVGDVVADGKPRCFDPARDMETLKVQAAMIGDVALIGVDPIVNMVTGDSHKNTETRRALQPFVDLASQLCAAAVGISHFSKGTAGRDPVERVTGSIAFGALARVVFGAAKQSDEQGGGRVLVRAKSNLGPDGGGFSYELHQAEVPGFPGILASQVRWGGAIDGSARELLATAEAIEELDDRSGKQTAKDFLLHILGSGRMDSKEVKRRADDEGISEKALRQARVELGICTDREGVGKTHRSYWRLPLVPSESTRAHFCPSEKVARVGTSEEEGISDGDVEVVL